MNYGFIITAAGWQLLSSLLAGQTLKLTKVMVGNGKMTANQSAADFTNLISPVSLAAYTTPVVENRSVSFTVEYRNDLNGGLDKGFWLTEFGIYAFDAAGNEILIYYATLGDYPQYVAPTSTGSVDIRRFPVTIALTDDCKVSINAPALAFMTSNEVAKYSVQVILPEAQSQARELIEAHNISDKAHLDIRNKIFGEFANRLQRLEDMLISDIKGNPFTITFDTLNGLIVSGVWNKSSSRIEF